MSKRFIFNLVVTIIVLIISISLYMLTVGEIDKNKEDKSIRYGGNNPHKSEVVQYVTLDKIEDDKAYFKEEVPDYVPGITSRYSVDMNFYKSSKFKDTNKLKLVRIYSEDDKGDPIHIYSFKKRSEKVE